MAILSPPPKLQFFDANGNPLVGGKLYSYAAGTTTPLATYTDSTETSANPNPVILDSRGEAGVWLSSFTYKLALYSSTDVLIWSVDNVNAAGLSDASVTSAKIANGAVTPEKMANGGAEFGMRNRIINGDMRIDQRNNGASVPNSGGFTVDRWADPFAGSGRYSAQRVTTAPAGFGNSLLHTITTAVSPAAADVYQVYQLVEANNTGDLNFGTASAATVTVSFWVRSSVTGTHAVSFGNGLPSTSERRYVSTYTVSVANTWEYKTLTIPGDTAGTWASNTTGVGMGIYFDLGSGSDHNTTAGSWQTGTATNALRRTAGSVSLISTAGATFYLTGVQIEKGSVATPFEQLSTGLQLMLCQRYYETITTGWINGFNAAAAVLNLQWRVPKRASPTVVLATGGAAVGNGVSNGINYASSIVGYTDGAYMDLNGVSAWTAAAAYSWRGGVVTASAEL